MAETTMMLSSEQHTQCAKALFNSVWTFLEMKDRSVDDDDLMVHTAHASLLHWLQVGTARNFARGEWQLSRVYAVLNRAEPALHHADRCLALCRDHDLGDFDLGFAYEAHARAHAVAGNENTGITITPETALSNWLGESMDTDIVVHHMELRE